MMDRLYRHWTYGGFLAGILLLVLTPLFAAQWPLALLAIFLHLPVYMLHQYEEHDANRFADFINHNIGGGAEVLTPPIVFLANIPGVWGVNAISIWLAATVSLGYGLIGVYLTLVNPAGPSPARLQPRTCLGNRSVPAAVGLVVGCHPRHR
jgi:hypothetical protein